MLANPLIYVQNLFLKVCISSAATLFYQDQTSPLMLKMQPYFTKKSLQKNGSEKFRKVELQKVAVAKGRTTFVYKQKLPKVMLRKIVLPKKSYQKLLSCEKAYQNCSVAKSRVAKSRTTVYFTG